ncbi:MAG: hypothetical protein RLZZ69_1148 [Cyanobacteriota bacterium]|jgi:hypothetical protein
MGEARLERVAIPAVFKRVRRDISKMFKYLYLDTSTL